MMISTLAPRATFAVAPAPKGLSKPFETGGDPSYLLMAQKAQIIKFVNNLPGEETEESGEEVVTMASSEDCCPCASCDLTVYPQSSNQDERLTLQWCGSDGTIHQTCLYGNQGGYLSQLNSLILQKMDQCWGMQIVCIGGYNWRSMKWHTGLNGASCSDCPPGLVPSDVWVSETENLNGIVNLPSGIDRVDNCWDNERSRWPLKLPPCEEFHVDCDKSPMPGNPNGNPGDPCAP